MRALETIIIGILLIVAPQEDGQTPKRARDLGIESGVFPTGANNLITDVEGVLVGHYSLNDPPRFNTGLTVILPHSGNLFFERVPAAISVGNGYGKLVGSTQVNELGELETPIVLTGTLNVPKLADGLISYMLSQHGMDKVYSINPVVGETNDGYLSDIRARPLGESELREALKSAETGAFALGAVGAGAGTVCFGFKGGIGSASRKLPASLGGWTIGVLVQTNFGGDLRIGGVAVGDLIGRRPYDAHLHSVGDGSCMIVIATDAPIEHRNLKRLADRSFLGMARVGGYASNGSGDYAIAFSVNQNLRRFSGNGVSTNLDNSSSKIVNSSMSPLFLAVVEATEEAIIDSMILAEDTVGFRGSVQRLPIEKILVRLIDR
jgi:D-aminopeptidase